MANTNINEISKSLETLYLDGKFDKAVDLLLESKNQLSAVDFHYNLGAVYTKMGDLGPGRYHFELAMKKGYIGSDLLNNLAVIKSKLQGVDLSLSRDIGDQLVNFLSMVPASYSICITLVLLITSLLVFKFKYIKSKIVLVSLLLLSFFPIALQQGVLYGKTFAVNLKDMKIYEGPSSVYDVRATLPGGSKFVLGKTDGEWFYIDHPIELAGWVKKEDIGIL
ncbi:SH3 domain-containing protein [Halobacteriovorax sp. JY17]|uniref:SH3 domain-containing protein n=1 Tax=Halobacteriovorax sp. JY17 TaxID=2014617 RepID=UPI0025C2A2EB|nr:SH3 domain-containing protein [Halobacteriovorax sp. JY17]